MNGQNNGLTRVMNHPGIGTHNFILQSLKEFWLNKYLVSKADEHEEQILAFEEPTRWSFIKRGVDQRFKEKKEENDLTTLQKIWFGVSCALATPPAIIAGFAISDYTGYWILGLIGGIGTWCFSAMILLFVTFLLEEVRVGMKSGSQAYKRYKASKKKADAYIQKRMDEFQAATDPDRANSIVEWLNDPDYGLLANLRQQTESARGDASGFLKNERAALEEGLQSLSNIRHTIEDQGLQDKDHEIDELEAALRHKLQDLTETEDVKILQFRLKQADERVKTVEAIAADLSARIPLEREIQKIRNLVNETPYGTIHPTRMAQRSFQAAMDKLEEIILQTEHLESALPDSLPDTRLPKTLNPVTATPMEKMLGA